MGFKSYAQQLNLEESVVDLSDIEEGMSIEDQIAAEEEEAGLVEASDTIENGETAIEEADEIVDDVASKVEEGEAVIKVAEEGDAVVADENVSEEAIEKAKDVVKDGEIPVEEVVAVQESLNSYIQLTGIEPSTLRVSREDIYNNPMESYKQNLEGFKEIGKSIKETAIKIWNKIVEAFKWIWEKITNIFKNKKAKAEMMLKKIENSSITLKDSDIKDKLGERYMGIANLAFKTDGKAVVGPKKYAEAITAQAASLVTIIDGIKKVADAAEEKSGIAGIGAKTAEAQIGNTGIAETFKRFQARNSNVIKGLISPTVYSDAMNKLKDNKKLPSPKDAVIISLGAKGKNINLTFLDPNFVKDKVSIEKNYTYTAMSADTVKDLLKEYIASFDAIAEGVKKTKESVGKLKERAIDGYGSIQGRLIMRGAESTATGVIKMFNTVTGELYNYSVALGSMIVKAEKEADKED